MLLWRAVDDEGEVLELLMQRRRDTSAARRFLERLLRRQPIETERITTDGLASYPAALRTLDLEHLHRPGQPRKNNRAENSPSPSADGREECSASGARHPPGASCLLTPPSTPP
ncbi:DDE-type integrase/transposase/recombinase [Caulobacter henricii]|nr:DDE-type integrase/transposase/recombinase [Caulobacter henricii]